MRIIFIAPRLPLPADTGGKIRTLNILRQLAKHAQIHLVCFSFGDDDQKLSRDLLNEGIETTLVPGRAFGTVSKIIQVLLDPLPVSIVKYYSEDMETILSEINDANTFDAVHIDHLHMAHYRDCIGGIPLVIDEHNVEYRILERCADVEKSFMKRSLFKDQARKMKDFERKSIKSVNAYLAVSDDDKRLLDELGDGSSCGYVVPNGVDTEYFCRGTACRARTSSSDGEVTEENAVVFTGSMDWLPNDDAVVYFCEDILPCIWKVKPDVKFYIVGKGATDRLQKLSKKEPRIVVTGRVDDVRVFVGRSKVFVVPLRIGGGTRLKILEAMAMEKAVVSTSVGAEGISYADGANIVLADQPEEFARNVIALINDRVKRKMLGQAGRKLVLEKYDWNIIGSRLKGIYEEAKIK